MVLSALFFSAMSLLVKLAGRRFPVMEIVFVRALVIAALASLDLLRRRVRVASPDAGLLLLRGVLGFSALSCFYFAVIRLPLAEVTVLHFTNPVWTAIIAAIFLRERLDGKELLLAVTSLAGVALVVRPFGLAGLGAPLDPRGVAAALTGAFLAAGAYVLVRRLRSVDAMLVVWYFAVVSVGAGFVLMLPDAVRPRGGEWLLLVGVGVSTFLGQVALTHGLKRERAGAATTVGYAQVVFAAGWGVLVFGDAVPPTTIAGAVVVLTCIVLLARRRAGARRIQRRTSR